MENLKFRNLRADEIDVRVAQITKKSVMLLLYKDARCDQSILDEAVGAMNWQRHHSRDNANCIVSIWDETKLDWVEKEDVGVESYTEKEKGLASDSFKRACVNWGIGRELYTSPSLYFPKEKCNIWVGNNGKEQCTDRFSVMEINYDDKKNIQSLTIINESNGEVLTASNISVPQKAKKKQTQKQDTKVIELKGLLAEVMKLCVDGGINPEYIVTRCKKERFSDISENQAKWLVNPNNWLKIVKEYGGNDNN